MSGVLAGPHEEEVQALNRQAMSIRTAARIIVAVIGAVVMAVPGWGYWHVVTHADVHVSLWDVALKTDRQLYGSLDAADVVFRDETGSVLANARAGTPLGIVSMIHPSAGDCRREEREGGEAWRQCYDTHSRWFITWARQVRSARVSFDACTIENVPVIVEESRDAWWLWWVPLPHIDNSSSTHFEFTLWIDSASCRAAESVRASE